VSFLRRCPKILLPKLRRPVAVRINVVHWLGVAMLVFILARSGSLIWL
jgi:hypothetical protein